MPPIKKTFHPTKFYDWSIHGRFGNGHFGNGLSGMIPWWPCAQVHNVDTGLPVSFAAGLTMLCENASGVSFSPPAPGDPLRCSGTTCGTCGQPWWMGPCGQYGRRECLRRWIMSPCLRCEKGQCGSLFRRFSLVEPAHTKYPPLAPHVKRLQVGCVGLGRSPRLWCTE